MDLATTTAQFQSSSPNDLVKFLMGIKLENAMATDRFCCKVLHSILWNHRLQINWTHVPKILDCFVNEEFKKETLDRILFCTKPTGFFDSEANNIYKKFSTNAKIDVAHLLLKHLQSSKYLISILRHLRMPMLEQTDQTKCQILQELLQLKRLKLYSHDLVEILECIIGITYKLIALETMFASKPQGLIHYQIPAILKCFPEGNSSGSKILSLSMGARAFRYRAFEIILKYLPKGCLAILDLTNICQILGSRKTDAYWLMRDYLTAESNIELQQSPYLQQRILN